jgi:hypothetical protein
VPRAPGAGDEPGAVAPAGGTRGAGAPARTAERGVRPRQTGRRSGDGDAGAVRATVRSGVRRDTGQLRCARRDLRPPRRATPRAGARRRPVEAVHTR